MYQDIVYCESFWVQLDLKFDKKMLKLQMRSRALILGHVSSKIKGPIQFKILFATVF